MAGLSDKRMLYVTGKGGVGKSTVAIALGIAAARRGLRTLVAELGGQERAAAAFGLAPGAAHAREVALEGRLWTTSVEPRHALEEYLRMRSGALGDLLASSRAFHAFAQATPGMRELLALGKVWELAQERRRVPGGDPYDLVVLDAPATGHGVGLLRTPRTFAEIARVGPIAQQGRTLDAAFRDPAHTAVVAVALAEEMPVNETIELRDALHGQLGIELALVVVNALYPERLGPRQLATVERALDRARTPLARTAMRAAISSQTRARDQREQVARLAEATGRDPLALPFVFAPAVDLAALHALAELLEPALAGS